MNKREKKKNTNYSLVTAYFFTSPLIDYPRLFEKQRLEEEKRRNARPFYARFGR